MVYTVLKADGGREGFTPAGKRPTLRELQGVVGGFIERLALGGGVELWMNEEGRILGLKPNGQASAVAGRLIVGDVLMAARGRGPVQERGR